MLEACLPTLGRTLAAMLLVAQAAGPPSPLAVAIQDRADAFHGVLGVAAKNLTTGESVFVNADTRFPTASSIKTAILVEAFRQIGEGKLQRDQIVTLREDEKVGGSGVLTNLHAGLPLTLTDLLVLMITQSDNTATNMVVGLVGTANVNRTLESYGIVETKLFRPTFRQGKPDVLPELEKEFGLGMTTPRDMARLMELIAEKKAVTPQASEEMLEILKRQRYVDMIPRALPAEAVVGNKTGQDEEKLAGADGRFRQVRADAAIVAGPKTRYVVAILTRQVDDTRFSVDNDALVVGGAISRLIYDAFNTP